MASILVVDDEIVCRKYLPLFLGEDGHLVQAVGTAREAIALGTTLRPDVLVTDWLLGEASDGIEVARALLAVRADMKVIFMTGLPADHLREHVRDLRAFEIVEKPLDLDQVLTQIRRILATPAF